MCLYLNDSMNGSMNHSMIQLITPGMNEWMKEYFSGQAISYMNRSATNKQSWMDKLIHPWINRWKITQMDEWIVLGMNNEEFHGWINEHSHEQMDNSMKWPHAGTKER